MKIVTIVGARPQFIKAAALSRQLRRIHTELLVHTGQHYDHSMSGVFFEGLEIPEPHINLEVGSGNHGSQTAAMLRGIEDVLLSERPDWMLVYGDTNSTLAGALAAAKLQVPVAHVEAGLRSFNRRMPEETNRVLTDHVSELLFCPSKTAVDNLAREGITKGVHIVGDIMRDVLLWAQERSRDRAEALLRSHQVEPKKFLLMTLHRNENTDMPERLSSIVAALNSISESIIFPVHPRTRKAIAAAGHRLGDHVRMIEPVGYFDMVCLSSAARLILTDSGGLQKEAYWLGVPCVTLRDETEWVETVDVGWNTLVGSNRDAIARAVASFVPPTQRPALYGEGVVAQRCVDLLR